MRSSASTRRACAGRGANRSGSPAVGDGKAFFRCPEDPRRHSARGGTCTSPSHLSRWDGKEVRTVQGSLFPAVSIHSPYSRLTPTPASAAFTQPLAKRCQSATMRAPGRPLRPATRAPGGIGSRLTLCFAGRSTEVCRHPRPAGGGARGEELRPAAASASSGAGAPFCPVPPSSHFTHITTCVACF